MPAALCRSRKCGGQAGSEESRGRGCSLVKQWPGNHETEGVPEKGARVEEEGARPPCPPLPVARLPKWPSMLRATDKRGFTGNRRGAGARRRLQTGFPVFLGRCPGLRTRTFPEPAGGPEEAAHTGSTNRRAPTRAWAQVCYRGLVGLTDTTSLSHRWAWGLSGRQGCLGCRAWHHLRYHLRILILHSHWLCDLPNIVTARIGQVFRYKWAASCLQGKTAGNMGAGVPGGGEFYLLPVTPHVEHECLRRARDVGNRLTTQRTAVMF